MRQKTLDEALEAVFAEPMNGATIRQYGPGLWKGADNELGGEILTSWELLRRMAEALAAKPKEPK